MGAIELTDLSARLGTLIPGAQVVSATPLGPDAPAGDGAHKAHGYGQPMKLEVVLPDGQHRAVVFHLQSADGYGHDRRADRAAGALLAFDTMQLVPHHVRPLDVGAIGPGTTLISLKDTSEPYLITEWAEGTVYAELLRHVAISGATEADVALARELARVCVTIHGGTTRGDRPTVYERAWRDLVGSGEGIAGIVDGYRDAAPALRRRLEVIERECLAWRHAFKGRHGRLTPVHGDFHPFNIVVGEGGQVTLLDTSRGSQGDPADDVACLAINFLLFGLGGHGAAWSRGTAHLYSAFMGEYVAAAGATVLEAMPPFLAWRALVVCHPGWYPHLWPADRERLLAFAERALQRGPYSLEQADEAMA